MNSGFNFGFVTVTIASTWNIIRKIWNKRQRINLQLDEEKERKKKAEEEEEDVDSLVDERILQEFIEKRMQEMMNLKEISNG